MDGTSKDNRDKWKTVVRETRAGGVFISLIARLFPELLIKGAHHKNLPGKYITEEEDDD